MTPIHQACPFHDPAVELASRLDSRDRSGQPAVRRSPVLCPELVSRARGRRSVSAPEALSEVVYTATLSLSASQPTTIPYQTIEHQAEGEPIANSTPTALSAAFRDLVVSRCPDGRAEERRHLPRSGELVVVCPKMALAGPGN